jgi:hypothetical protein
VPVVQVRVLPLSELEVQHATRDAGVDLADLIFAVTVMDVVVRPELWPKLFRRKRDLRKVQT